MEGGQMPLARRLPKFGFHNRFRKPRQVVNLKDLGRFEKDSLVDRASLAQAGLVAHDDIPVKVLADGELSVALILRVDAVSRAARQKIEAAGGSIEILPEGRASKAEVAES
jgi:large subunit ribosomal protein L15